MLPQDWQHIKHFKPEEFLFDPTKVCLEFALSLDHLREVCGIPIHINCVWAADGHAGKSLHYLGQAGDIHFGRHFDYKQQFKWIEQVQEFGGIGFYPNWNTKGWHVDIRPRDKSGNRLYWAASEIVITGKNGKKDKKQVYTYGRDVLVKSLLAVG
jgi:hypothetical protein